LLQVLITLALLLAVTVAVPQGRFFGGGGFRRPVVGLRPIGGFGGLGGGGLGGFGGFGKTKFASQLLPQTICIFLIPQEEVEVVPVLEQDLPA
jgi:hypothetical protein